MAANKRQNGDWISWVLIVFLFGIGIWPVALILLFVKLFGSDEKKKKAIPPLREGSVGESASNQHPNKARSAVKKVTKSPAVKKSNAKWLKVIGAVVAVVGVLTMWGPIEAFFWSSNWYSLWLPELLQYLAFTVAGAAMFFGGVAMDRSLKRYAKYLSVIGDREAMDLGQLARTLGYSRRRVEKDLQKMIDKGYFGGAAYLDQELGYLFRSSQAGEAAQKARQAPPKETEEGYTGILRNIRRANDQIADPLLSAKIDRLENITAKIFRAVEEDPQKRGRIDTFFDYYLPTTQKLLDSYAEFEAAGIEGENLRQAKSRIASTMDAIVQGFERQLDELYKADAMDVDSDIRVMETMLRRDGASVERDFGLGQQRVQKEPDGGAAVQTAEKPEP